jgi:subfamily B ATP-binding cassette protein MsbA
MKKFYKIFAEFMPKYKVQIVLTVVFTTLASFFGIFQFMTLAPVLEMLFNEGKNFVSEKPEIVWNFSGIVESVTDYAYWYLGKVAQEDGRTYVLVTICIFMSVMVFFKTLTTYVSNITLAYVKVGIIRDLRNKIFDKLLTLPMAYFSEQRKGDIMARMTQDVLAIQTTLANSIQLIFKNPIMIITTIMAMVVISWKLSLFIVIFVPIAGSVLGRIGKSLKKKTYENQKKEGEVLSSVEETLSGLRIIKSYNAEKRVNAFFKNIVELTRKIQYKVDSKYLLAHPVSEFLGTIIILTVAVYGGSLIFNGNDDLSAPAFLVFLGMIYNLLLPLKQISQLSYNIRKGLASVDRIEEIILADNNIQDPEKPVEFPEFKESIEYKNVSFKYNTDFVLKDVSVKINKGQSVALVGQSGSGKSTFVDLLTRFWDVNKGEICLDGVNIKDYRVVDLRAKTGNVSQDTILFNDTFKANISFSKPDATDEEIIEAAKIANAHNFIMDSENQYDTNIGDRGGNLSGGQRQRLSIARAVLCNPPIMILDEATSALDTESEKLVQDAITSLMKNRTSVIVAHRLSTIKHCDVIYVFKEGRIVEQGTHDELIEKAGEYKKLSDMQQL